MEREEEHRNEIDCPCLVAGYVQKVYGLNEHGMYTGWLMRFTHEPAVARVRSGVGHP